MPTAPLNADVSRNGKASVRFQGRITDWRDDKGFGFITPNGGGESAFVHIKSFPRGARRPVQEDRVNYTLERDDQGRLRAANVAYVAKSKIIPSSGKSAKPVLLGVAGIFVILVVALAVVGRLPPIVAVVYFVMSILTFGAYAFDKAAARADRWRTQESTLQLLGLLGGWPGGLVAQQLLRHKSKKVSFIAVFWFSAAANVAVLLWLLSPYGKAFIASLVSG
jgi:uncharacterized membrane protein YsdA (DUF1294 family)/cold shock CspA family protein